MPWWLYLLIGFLLFFYWIWWEFKHAINLPPDFNLDDLDSEIENVRTRARERLQEITEGEKKGDRIA